MTKTTKQQGIKALMLVGILAVFVLAATAFAQQESSGEPRELPQIAFPDAPEILSMFGGRLDAESLPVFDRTPPYPFEVYNRLEASGLKRPFRDLLLANQLCSRQYTTIAAFSRSHEMFVAISYSCAGVCQASAVRSVVKNGNPVPVASSNLETLPEVFCQRLFDKVLGGGK
jgi:hypothetical protein